MTRLFGIIAGGFLALAVFVGLELALHAMGEECRHHHSPTTGRKT